MVAFKLAVLIVVLAHSSPTYTSGPGCVTLPSYDACHGWRVVVRCWGFVVVVVVAVVSAAFDLHGYRHPCGPRGAYIPE